MPRRDVLRTSTVSQCYIAICGVVSGGDVSSALTFPTTGLDPSIRLERPLVVDRRKHGPRKVLLATDIYVGSCRCMISDGRETDVALPHHVERQSARRPAEMLWKSYKICRSIHIFSMLESLGRAVPPAEKRVWSGGYFLRLTNSSALH